MAHRAKGSNTAHIERAIDTTFMYTGHNNSLNRNYSSLFISSSINNSEQASPDSFIDKRNKESK